MLPPFMGQVLLVGTAGSVVLALVVGLWAARTGRFGLSKGVGLVGGGIIAVYALCWILGLALSPRSELPPGRTVSFCGLDCHLHVSVAEVHLGDGLGVLVKFESNAVRAPEYPAELRFRLRDAAGKEHAPTNEVPGTALAAGETRLHELRFPGGIAPAGSALIVTWKAGLDYLVPGAGNPLVQARRRLLLPPVVPSGA